MSTSSTSCAITNDNYFTCQHRSTSCAITNDNDDADDNNESKQLVARENCVGLSQCSGPMWLNTDSTYVKKLFQCVIVLSMLIYIYYIKASDQLW